MRRALHREVLREFARCRHIRRSTAPSSALLRRTRVIPRSAVAPTAAPRSRASGMSSTGLAIARRSRAQGVVRAAPRRCVFGASDLWSAFPLRLLVLTRLIVRVLRCGGADWCGLVLGRVESWVRALGFSPFFSFPGPPGFTRAADQKSLLELNIGKCTNNN